MYTKLPIYALFVAAGCSTLTLAQQTLPPGTQDPDTQVQRTEDPLASVEESISKADFMGARMQLDIYMASHANDARAFFDSGYIDDAQGKDDAAATSYRKAIEIDPKQFEAHLSLGLLLARLNQPEAAKKELLAATGLTPAADEANAKGRAWRALAQLLRSTEPASAKQALLEAMKITPETPDDILLTAEIAEASDDSLSAETAYRRVVAQQPESAPAVAGLAHLLLKQKKYAEAEPLLRTALAKDAANPALNSQLAAILLAQDKQDEALQLLHDAHEKAPTNPELARMLADLLMTTGDAASSANLYRQLVQAQPENADLLTDYGQALVRQQKFSEAIPAFQKATQLNQRNVDAWSGLAFAASELHKPELTLQALSERAKLTPDTAPICFLRATAYDNLHLKKQAVEAYRQFLATAGGKFPNQEWQAKQRLAALEKMH